jgi:hypothetical protein
VVAVAVGVAHAVVPVSGLVTWLHILAIIAFLLIVVGAAAWIVWLGLRHETFSGEPRIKPRVFIGWKRLIALIAVYLLVTPAACIAVTMAGLWEWPGDDRYHCGEGTVYQEYVTGSGKSEHRDWVCVAAR